jgi:hypothetical protein
MAKTSQVSNVNKSSIGARGSIFDDDSAACHVALTDLWVVMREVGFIVDKKRTSESTLRAYVGERLRYPLLNPKFRRAAVRRSASRAVLEITVLSKGDPGLSRRLGSFQDSTEVTFVASESKEGRYFNHGHFLIPLVFQGSGRSSQLDLKALGRGLSSILRHVQQAA